jgi:small-conductance mechanosensitive channel
VNLIATYKEILAKNRNRILLWGLLFVFLIFIQIQELRLAIGLTLENELWLKLIHLLSIGVGTELGKFFLVRYYLLKNKREGNTHGTAVSLGLDLITRIIYAVLFFLGVLALNQISPKDVFTSLSIVAAAIALISKDYIANMINGMIMTFTNQINVGDQIKVGDIKGKILSVTLSNIHVLSDEDDLVFIPNTLAFNSNMINYTRRKIRKLSIDFEVSYPLPMPIDEIDKYLVEVSSKYGEGYQPHGFNLKTMNVKKDFVELKFQVVLNDDLDRETEKQIRKRIIRALVDKLNAKFL